MLFDHQRKGMTFIEVLVGMTLLFALIAIIGTVANSFSISRKTRFKQEAYLLTSEELDTLRGLNFGALNNVSDVPFKYILYPRGKFIVQNTSSQSSPNSIQVVQHNSAVNNITAIALPPIGQIITDGTLTTYISVGSEATSSWDVGFLFRALDENNTYLVTLGDTRVRLSKFVAGVETELFSSPQTLTTDTWYKLEVILTGDQIDVELNDVPLNGSPIVDGSFDDGYFSLAALSNTPASFDTVSYVSPVSTYTWNFDGAENEVDSEAMGWKRATPYSLPSASTSLTISDEETDGSSPLKNIIATINWDDGNTQSVTIETYVSETGVTK